MEGNQMKRNQISCQRIRSMHATLGINYSSTSTAAPVFSSSRVYIVLEYQVVECRISQSLFEHRTLLWSTFSTTRFCYFVGRTLEVGGHMKMRDWRVLQHRGHIINRTRALSTFARSRTYNCRMRARRVCRIEDLECVAGEFARSRTPCACGEAFLTSQHSPIVFNVAALSHHWTVMLSRGEENSLASIIRNKQQITT